MFNMALHAVPRRAPAVNITVITRLEASGTTALFTEYLDKASALWTLGTGFTVNFPDIVRSVTGTGSVVSAVSAVGNSIGWVPRHPVRRQPKGSYLAPAFSRAMSDLPASRSPACCHRVLCSMRHRLLSLQLRYLRRWPCCWSD